MDQQTKQELLRRWRERNLPGVVHDETIVNWIIDIVADARELELSETMAALRGRSFGAIETPAIRIEVDQPVYDPEEAAKRIAADIAAGAWTCDPKDVEVTIGDGDPRSLWTSEYIEGLWSTSARVQVFDIVSTTSAGRIGRFDLVTHDDGSVWAWTLEEPGVTVMVVKPDPEAGQ